MKMIHDPIVDEVRAIREQLAARFDFDIRKIVKGCPRTTSIFPSSCCVVPKTAPGATADRGCHIGF